MNATTRARKARRTKATTPRLVGYVRVSTTEQRDEGVSLRAQRERLRAYCAALGFELVAVHADEGVSGALPPHRRPALSRALADVAKGNADGVLVVKLDRLSRSVMHTLRLMDRSRREGWRLVSVAEQLDGGTPVGRMVMTVLAALAEMEREQLAERTREGMAQLVRDGRLRSRHVPFGYRLEGLEATDAHEVPKAARGRRVVPHDDEQEILDAMLALRDEGKGAQRIRNALNAEGIVNPRTRKPWSTGTVAAILRSHDRRVTALDAA